MSKSLCSHGYDKNGNVECPHCPKTDNPLRSHPAIHDDGGWGHQAKREAELAKLRAECERLRKWVNDLHSGMYINCVYCGHRYGPKDEVPDSMADVLKRHVEKCPKHPMSALKAEVERLREVLGDVADVVSDGRLVAADDADIEGLDRWLSVARTVLGGEKEVKR